MSAKLEDLQALLSEIDQSTSDALRAFQEFPDIVVHTHVAHALTAFSTARDEIRQAIKLQIQIEGL